MEICAVCWTCLEIPKAWLLELRKLLDVDEGHSSLSDDFGTWQSDGLCDPRCLSYWDLHPRPEVGHKCGDRSASLMNWIGHPP